MSDSVGQILGVVAVLAIFIVIIMNTIFPAIKDNGTKLEEKITDTNYGYIIEENRYDAFL
ncbi:hypothetical protein [Oceanobacillus luteolus]|uniref:Uncharacterized protein n=1 Tax=Oceanobacillus luteolus TaxID=1274358 RepID=A0ABW4HX23_9BACI